MRSPFIFQPVKLEVVSTEGNTKLDMVTPFSSIVVPLLSSAVVPVEGMGEWNCKELSLWSVRLITVITSLMKLSLSDCITISKELIHGTHAVCTRMAHRFILF